MTQSKQAVVDWQEEHARLGQALADIQEIADRDSSNPHALLEEIVRCSMNALAVPELRKAHWSDAEPARMRQWATGELETTPAQWEDWERDGVPKAIIPERLLKTCKQLFAKYAAAERLLTAVRGEMEEADFDPTDDGTIYGQICRLLDA